MPVITEPIYRAHVRLTFVDAFQKSREIAQRYRIKDCDDKRGRVILDVSYLFTFFMYATWIREVVVDITPVRNDVTLVQIYGKPSLSPLRLLQIPSLMKKKVSKDKLLSDFKSVLEQFEIGNIEGEDVEPTLKATIAFWFLESLSLIMLISIVVCRLYFGIFPTDKPSVFAVFSFVLAQVILIVWFTRDCYTRKFASYTQRSRWISLIAISGFIGSAVYYFMVYRKRERA